MIVTTTIIQWPLSLAFEFVSHQYEVWTPKCSSVSGRRGALGITQSPLIHKLQKMILDASTKNNSACKPFNRNILRWTNYENFVLVRLEPTPITAKIWLTGPPAKYAILLAVTPWHTSTTTNAVSLLFHHLPFCCWQDLNPQPSKRWYGSLANKVGIIVRLQVIDKLLFLWTHKLLLKLTFMCPTGRTSIYSLSEKFNANHWRYSANIATKHHNITIRHCNILIAIYKCAPVLQTRLVA